MTDTHEEEARRCPSCEEPGTLLNRRRVSAAAGLPQGTMVSMYECRNDRCPDYVPPEMVAGPGSDLLIPGERYRWAVQTNPDGTIPPKGTGGQGPKNYDQPAVHTAAAQRARDNLALLAATDERGSNDEAYQIARDLGYG